MINVQQNSTAEGGDGSNPSALIMPEYGRNVQHMVEYALTIQDKDERTKCVAAIMQTMGNLFPYLRNGESRHKMYDHLAMMSDFRLDIDSPYSKPDRDNLKYRPQTLHYNTRTPVRYRHYGRLIEVMVAEAVAEQDEARKQQLTLRIASRMRQNYFIWNKDAVDRAHIEDDIRQLSQGRLSCDFEAFDAFFTRPVYGGQWHHASSMQHNNGANNGKWKKNRKKQ